MEIALLVKALAPAFAAGFAVQRLLEILDPILDRFQKGEYKRIALGLISFGVGLGIAAWPKIRVLRDLVPADIVPRMLDFFVTALVVSGGTEGFNSIIKFLSYKKEETKEEAKGKGAEAQTKAVAAASVTAAFERRLDATCTYTPEEIEGIVVSVYRTQLDDDSITRVSRFGPGKEIDIDSDARRAFFFPIKQNVDRQPNCVIKKLTPADVQAAKTVGEVIDDICEEFGI